MKKKNKLPRAFFRVKQGTIIFKPKKGKGSYSRKEEKDVQGN